MAGTLRLEAVTARYGERTALDSVDLEIPAGQLVSILGPSGSGKSTLLRIVAGLEGTARGGIRYPIPTFALRAQAEMPPSYVELEKRWREEK